MISKSCFIEKLFNSICEFTLIKSKQVITATTLSELFITGVKKVSKWNISDCKISRSLTSNSLAIHSAPALLLRQHPEKSKLLPLQ